MKGSKYGDVQPTTLKRKVREGTTSLASARRGMCTLGIMNVQMVTSYDRNENRIHASTGIVQFAQNVDELARLISDPEARLRDTIADQTTIAPKRFTRRTTGRKYYSIRDTRHRSSVR